MASVSANIHFEPGTELMFSECEHGTMERSVNIGDQTYGHVTLFITYQQAIEIRDHFANLVDRWSMDIDRGEAVVNGRGEELDTLANLGLCEADFR